MLSKAKSASGGRKIIVLEFLTLDGVMQAPGGPKEDSSESFKYGGWTVPYFDDFSGKEMGKQMSRPSDLLLGRKTYEIFAGYWPHHEDAWPGINSAKKYVVSHSSMHLEWSNSILIKDNVVKEIKKLKQKDGPDLKVWGSGNLVQTLMKHDLADQFWLKIFPLTLGSGKKLFDKGTIPAAFKLMESKTSPSGVIIASFKRAGKVKTGSF
ncbi:riboflavin biosynthesis protein RibD [Candidatus Gottesmanbacteria bacterium RIFCSPHIGHO2_01_FULL_39_10]|uniref:Riboflavin biosynthesis protein RibD n=1 Tax=Candidatus Gottesmanbacteria bacterium RIFCSPHIGHO2_01_FULL_39_10 TaxID=1798375 RepID=A0A1F5ZK88_9BACT|nr:MAG: riboflavin biosynthesis protein RibD [Candidatus Gottesmanbacteria bacterium RIFCSPHIGHO2_01_FULL_39_10]